jgi:hypothetical protein
MIIDHILPVDCGIDSPPFKPEQMGPTTWSTFCALPGMKILPLTGASDPERD